MLYNILVFKNKGNSMSANEDNCKVESVKRDILLVNIVVLFFLILFGAYAVLNTRKDTMLTNKIVELSQKADVPVEATTNTLFGILTKVQLVK